MKAIIHLNWKICNKVKNIVKILKLIMISYADFAVSLAVSLLEIILQIKIFQTAKR